MINIKNEFSLSYPQVRELSQKYNLIPVYKEIIADCETPVSAFMKISEGERYACLLESVEGSERWGRYSFIVYSPECVAVSSGNKFTCRYKSGRVDEKSVKNPLDELRNLMRKYSPAKVDGLPRFWGGAVGYSSYDIVRFIEDLPDMPPSDLNLPDMLYMITNNMVVFDHLYHTLKIISCIDLTDRKISEKIYAQTCGSIDKTIKKIKKGAISAARKRCAKVKSSIEPKTPKPKFIESVKKAKKYIHNGDAIQVVLSQRFDVKTSSDPLDIYRALRIVNPSPYMYHFNLDEFCIIGSSPEILVRKEGDIAITKPIAGTRYRGKNLAEDQKLIDDLLADPKERAEHIMLVDLGRNDLARVCEISSVKVAEMMSIEKYSHVIHMVSTVTGRMAKNADSFALFKACFPAGTVSGAPKVRAMEIIDELEPVSRGPYAGAVGYFSYDGNMDMAITIRTIVLKDGIAHIQAGAGIVADSVPEKEYLETLNKAGALFKSLELASEIGEQKI